MPAFVAPLVGFALGALLAWLRAAAPRSPVSVAWGGAASSSTSRALAAADRRPLLLSSLFSLLVFTPVCAYFLVFAPDWSFAYLVDSRRIPSAVDLVLLALDAASVPAGFAAVTHAEGRRSLRDLAVLIGAPLAVALLVVLVLSRRLAVDGTYRQLHGDFGVRPVAGGPLGYALLWMDGLLAAGLLLTARAMLAPGAPAARPAPGEPPRKPSLRPGPAAGPAPRPSLQGAPGGPPRSGPAAAAPPAVPRRLGSAPPPGRPRLGRGRANE